jgi:hypothetical protein
MSYRPSRVVRRRSVVAALLVAFVSAGGGVVAIANASKTAPLFLVTPTALSFGYVPVGSTAAQQAVTVTNVSGRSQMMSGVGGGAGVFGGAQNCQGQTLAPGASCQMFYAFSPTKTGTVNGSANGSWNGQSFSLKFTGTGTS